MRKIVRVGDQKFTCYPIKNGEGKYAKCYLTKDNKVLKVYQNLKDDDIYYEHVLRPLEGIKNETFIFPEELIANDDIVLGYICKYIKGEILTNNKNINVEQFISMLSKAYSDIETISEKKIYTSDMGSRNIIFNNKFNIIDTDNYFVFEHLDVDSCLKSNIEVFNRSILDYILKKDRLDHNLYAFIHGNSKLDYMTYELVNQNDPNPILEDFLEKLIYSLEKETGNKIKTFNDIHKSLVRR